MPYWAIYLSVHNIITNDKHTCIEITTVSSFIVQGCINKTFYYKGQYPIF